MDDSQTSTAPRGPSAPGHDLSLPASIQRLLTREESAYALGIGLRKMAELIASGDIPVVRIGTVVRIKPAALNEFIDARESRHKLKGKSKKNPTGGPGRD